MPNTFIQLSSGQGPQECRAFIPLLAGLIRQDAQASGVRLIDLGCFPENTPLPASCSFAVRETVPPDFRSRWEGTVQWIWRSTIRPHHPRKNWFVKVSFHTAGDHTVTAVRSSDLSWVRPPEQLERPAGFPSSDKTRPDSPVSTLQGLCDPPPAPSSPVPGTTTQPAVSEFIKQ